MPAVFDNNNPFASSKKSEEVLACFWYNQLWNKLFSAFQWKGPLFEGPSATCNRDFLEWVLLTQGQAGFLKDNEGKIRSLQCSRIGFDPYMFPTTLQSSNPVLGNIIGTVDVDAVWVRNNKFAVPAIQVVKYYAQQLAKIQLSLNVSLNNNRMTKILMADNSEQANQLRKLVDDVSAGKEAVIVNRSLRDMINPGIGTKVPVFSTPSEYLADKYLQNMREIVEDFYATLGINSSGANMVKKERNLVDEVNANNTQIAINREYWLSTRKLACEKIKEVFGVECSCDLVEGDVIANDISEPEFSDEQA